MADKKKSKNNDSEEAQSNGEEAVQMEEKVETPQESSDDIATDASETDEALSEVSKEEQAETEPEAAVPEDVSEASNPADEDVSAEDEASEDAKTDKEAEEPVSDIDQIEAEPEPVNQEPRLQPAAAPAPKSSAGVGTMLVGGLLAGAIGYLLASANLLPAPWKAVDPAIGELRSEMEAQASVVEAQGALIEGLGSSDTSQLEIRMGELAGQITGLDGRLNEAGESIAALGKRIEALEARPVGDGSSAGATVDLSAYEAQLAALEETVQSQRAEVEAMIADAKALDEQAAASQKRAAIQAGVARLQAALEQGVPFQDVLDDLSAVGASVPDALSAAAGDGVATMSTLRSGFPDAARDSLARVRSGTESSGSIGAFLQRQLGARSVEPREGDDADAVLSRIEASLTSGDLAAALGEVDALPEAAVPALSSWVALAQKRLAAQQAIGELAADATEN